MKKSRKTSMPGKMKLALERELDSHVSTSLQSEQLRKTQNAARGIPRSSRKAAKKAGPSVLGVFRIFSSGLGPIARSGISELREGGWVLLAVVNPGQLAKIEVQAKGDEYLISRVVTGAVVAELNAALEKLKDRRQEREKEELRFLSIPAMHVMALWLHFPDHAQRDLFVPISLNFTGLQQKRTYSRSAIETLLRRHATDLILHWYERSQGGTNPDTVNDMPVDIPKRANRSRRSAALYA
jgi:hypothetical protein